MVLFKNLIMEESRMRKKLLFLWCLLSLLGLIISLFDLSLLGDIEDFILGWAITSVPLIIHLIYFKIFGKE